MPDERRIPPEVHASQIEAYTAEQPHYRTFAASLKRVLEHACKVSIPEAFVQTREKSVSSFAEKCARKYDKYKDAARELTDLCGGRVIVQTLEQVEAVTQFIRSNFIICEEDEKGSSLGEDRFGYRDMHFIVQLDPNSCDMLGITYDEQKSIGIRKAEIQVRTWLQHAWADTLHDRIYKNSLPVSQEIKRTGHLLAALMEEGDRNYNTMAHEIDGMIANYTAHATREHVLKEIEIQRIILANEPDAAKKPGLSLKIARLLAACGEYNSVVTTLDPHKDIQDANRCELSQDLGYALCKIHRSTPASQEYQRGLGLLKESRELCSYTQGPFVQNQRKGDGLHARAIARLAWALEVIPGEEYRARENWHRAHEREPANPYYLTDMLGYEIHCSHTTALPAAMRTTLNEANRTCRAHAEANIELPSAYFTAGRLNLLLNNPYDALGYYARGIQHVLAASYCFPADVLEVEATWIRRLHIGQKPPDAFLWAIELLDLAKRVQSLTGNPTAGTVKALIIAGGAASMANEMLDRIRPLLETALLSFTGKVISGGTVSGVPGLVGEIAESLRASGQKHFDLVGYICRHLPHDAPEDKRYDHHVVCGEGKLSPVQLLKNWSDLLDDGVHPGEVLLLGFGGGPLTSVEYRMALAFGATVAVVSGTGGSADALIQDKLWANLSNLLPLPADETTFRALVVSPSREYDGKTLESMAIAFHDNYMKDSAGSLPDNMKPWPRLGDTYRQANYEQAKYAVLILESSGFSVREADEPVVFDANQFTPEELERMAEMEHGRWNVERLRSGWKPGPRDNVRKIHNCLVSWKQLPDSIKEYDRNSVRKFPEILAKAGLEVYRK